MKQLSTFHHLPVACSKKSWLAKLLFPALLLGYSYQAQAQFPRVESFQGATAGGFTLGGTAKLTAAVGGSDAEGAGYLRLTSASLNQSGFAIDQGSFPAPNGFSISFEFFAYGGSGADGFSVFLVDADQTSAATFTPGASGGSLGYGQKTITPVSDGVPFGYIGIGIDEFGNYSNATEGRVGGITPSRQTPDAVAIRGAGNGRGPDDYPYLAGTPTLPFSLDVGTTRAQAGSADYRRAYIDVVPTNGTYRITVRIQHGLAIETAVRNFIVPAPPPNLRIGFAGSTGGSTNFHEIRKLAVRQTPFLSDDLAATNYNQAITVDVLANDVFNYANYAPGSVDLDINEDGIQSSLTLAGQGTLAVTPAGVVTFTPSGTFAGVVTVPYTAADVLDNVGSPANLVITVRGADIANSVSGPTAAGPGSQVTYTLTSTNLGPLPATNVVPTLQLPAGLSGVAVSSGSYDAASGLVTFEAGSLAVGGAPITNTVSFTAPASGSVTGTVANTATEPDPAPANNIASITTLISGLANVADVCAMPGKDGIGALDATSAPNTYFAGQSVTTEATSRILVGPALSGSGASPTPIVAGDLVLVMQMQGAPLNTTNSAAYGSGTASGQGNLSGADDQFTAGLYEYAVATNSVDATGGTLTLDRTLTHAYDNLDYDAASNPTGQRRFQVVRVPQYSALTVADSVAGAPWNGTAGGVLALDVAGRTTFTTNALLTMTGRGFRGGGGQRYTGTTDTTYTSTNFRQLSSASLTGSGGAKGEGTAGTPYYVNATELSGAAQAVSSTGLEGYREGSNGRGAPGNAGGGGTDGTPNDNQRNSGGGGGANGGGGGFGGYAWTYTGAGPDNAQGIGGAAFGASAGRLVMGGGGGAGSRNDEGPSSGSRGGGIILLRTGAVAGPGRVVANGLSAPTTANDGGGGGGAGGAVLLLAANAGTLRDLTVLAHGGQGASANVADPDTAGAYGPGGGGGGGVVLTNGAVAAASSVAGGANGRTTLNLLAFGATPGLDGTLRTAAAASGSGTAECLPALTVAMSATTPAVSRTGGAAGPVSPATYTLNISNTGGTSTNTTVMSSLPGALFRYDASFPPVVTLTMPDGRTATPTGYTPPASGVSQPEFRGFTMPAGATLTIKFRATIDAAAQNNVPYQASTTVSYDNPRRTSAATATIQPGQNYADSTDTSLGTAGGSNFDGSSTTAEDVTVVAPLPVSLTRFTAAAQRLDAQLRWTTATELNNDRFVVERSLDGAAFEAVGSVRGQGASAKATSYEFLDAGAARLTAAGQPVYYRLRQVDTEGPGTYSPVRSVVFGARGAVTVFPNPAGRAATLDLSGLPAGSYQVQVLDLTGRAVASYTLTGGIRHALDLQALAAGTYVVRVQGRALSQSLLLTRE